MSTEIEIIAPWPKSGDLADALRGLVRRIHESGLKDRAVCGVFGGEFGYGTDFENETFAMHWDRQHPECDCGGSQPKHKRTCVTVTKRRAWLNERNMVGMVEVKPKGDGSFLDMGYWQSTKTTWKEQDAWMKRNPFPSCDCGEEKAWLKKNKRKKVPDQDWGSPNDWPHAPSCDWSIVHRPNFEHKKSGSSVCWYKYIGRDMKPNLKAASWDLVFAHCHASLDVMLKEKSGGK